MTAASYFHFAVLCSFATLQDITLGEKEFSVEPPRRKVRIEGL